MKIKDYFISSGLLKYLEEHYPTTEEIKFGIVGMNIRLANTNEWIIVFYNDIIKTSN